MPPPPQKKGGGEIIEKITEQNRTYLLFTPRYSKYTTWANEIINMNMPFVRTAYVVALIKKKKKKKTTVDSVDLNNNAVWTKSY